MNLKPHLFILPVAKYNHMLFQIIKQKRSTIVCQNIFVCWEWSFYICWWCRTVLEQCQFVRWKFGYKYRQQFWNQDFLLEPILAFDWIPYRSMISMNFEYVILFPNFGLMAILAFQVPLLQAPNKRSYFWCTPNLSLCLYRQTTLLLSWLNLHLCCRMYQ